MLGGACVGVGLNLGPLVFTVLAFRADTDSDLPLLWVALATIAGFGGGWAFCFLLLRRAAIRRPKAAAWWAWGISLAASVVVNVVVAAVAFVVALMSVALLWSSDWLAPISTAALTVSGVITLVTAVLVTVAAARRTQPVVSGITPYG